MEKISRMFDEAVSETELYVTAEQKQKLLSFLQLLHKWNKAYNLTSVRDPEQMLYVHILDSIVISSYVSKNRYIDVGTGPGLPGIPLAIMHPDNHFVLLDSLGKRIRFIKQVAYELSLPNIEPVQSRVEDYQPETPFEGVLSRAFASVQDMLNWCQHLTDKNGLYLALKGQFPEDELAALPGGFKMQSSEAIVVPGLEAKRHLVTLVKE